MSDQPPRPYHITKAEREQGALLQAVAALVRALGKDAPKIDGSVVIKSCITDNEEQHGGSE